MIEIITLGSFSININGEDVSSGSRRTTKLWKLLNLFIVNRGKPLSSGVILESIWDEEEAEISNKALHNLIYRLRTLFAVGGADDCISFKGNSYMFNTKKTIAIDVYDMEDLYNEATKADLSIEKRTELLENAANLYNGEYTLNSFCSNIWSATAVNRYKRIFSEIVCRLADIYYETGKYDEVITICHKGIAHEPLEELFYQRLVKGMLSKGLILQSITVCEEFIDLIYSELGMRVSDTFYDIYKKLKGNIIQLQHNVDYALKEMNEVESLDTALYCNFDVFKDLYRYEIRKAARLGTTVFILLASINDRNNDIPTPKVLGNAKRCLQDCCMAVLRRGDVVANYSQTQTILMLTDLTEDSTPHLISRIEKEFASRYSGEKVIIRFDSKDALDEK